MTVVRPGMTSEGQRMAFKASSSHDGLIERYKAKSMEGILELHNKTPVWNDDTQSYVLNFHGRVTQASVKNFQVLSFCSHGRSKKSFLEFKRNTLQANNFHL